MRYQTPSLEQLSLFTSNLATLLRTGVSLLASLDALARQEKGRGLGIVAERLKGEIGRGLSLADALAKHPRVFTPVYCGVVKAGEKSGSIDLALRDLAAYLSWQDALRGEVRKAVSYPLLCPRTRTGDHGAGKWVGACVWPLAAFPSLQKLQAR